MNEQIDLDMSSMPLGLLYPEVILKQIAEQAPGKSIHAVTSLTPFGVLELSSLIGFVESAELVGPQKIKIKIKALKEGESIHKISVDCVAQVREGVVQEERLTLLNFIDDRTGVESL